MMFVLKGLLILICLIIAGSLFVYYSVIYKQNCVKKSYKLIDSLLQKRYALISSIISHIQSIYNNPSQISYILGLRDEVMTMDSSYENLDRKFAFDGELSTNMKSLIETLSNTDIQDNTELSNIIQTYNDLDKKIKACGKIYNKNAKILRHAVDVFPSSFISRLSRIKYANSFKA